VVLWRHGRTEWNATGKLQGQTEVPLDDVGRQQAVAGAAALALEFPQAVVVSSNLGRASATAHEYAELIGVPVAVDERLRERSFGDWEGLTADEIEQRWPEGYQAWQQGDDRTGTPSGGESRQQVGRRVAEAIEELAREADGSTLVVVSHGAAITAAITTMLGQDAGTWRGLTGIDNTHWSVLRRSRPGVVPGWRLIAHNVGSVPVSGATSAAHSGLMADQAASTASRFG